MKKIIVALLAVAALATNAAYAALPASVGTTVTSIQADGQSVFDLVFPVVATFIGLTIVIKLFKRFTSKV
jgi:NADH:ubiquinone oxidoreductase subunit K